MSIGSCCNICDTCCVLLYPCDNKEKDARDLNNVDLVNLAMQINCTRISLYFMFAIDIIGAVGAVIYHAKNNKPIEYTFEAIGTVSALFSIYYLNGLHRMVRAYNSNLADVFSP